MNLHFKSLKTRLAFWFLTVTMLSLTAVVTILYFQRASAIRDQEFEKLQMVRDLKVAKLSSWIDERVGDLEVASGDDEIQILEKVFMNNGSESAPSTISTARSLLQRYLDHYNAYDELFIVSASRGKVAISTDLAHEGLDKKTDLYFTEPLRTRNSYIKDIYYSKAEQSPAMAFSTPIFCLTHDGEHLIGVLVARINLEQSLYPLLQDRVGMGKTGETLIVNQDGIALNDLRWQENSALRLTISAQPAVKAAAGETGIVETGDYRGEQVLAAYTHIPQMGWGIVVKRDLVEVHAPIHAMLRSMIFAAVAVALIVILVSLLLARGISRPVIGIGDAVLRFTAGDREVRCPVKGVDEVAALAMEFNEMITALNTQMAIRQGISEISEVMVVADNVADFSSGLLMKLMDLSGSQLGAFYMRSESGDRFDQVASVGLSNDAAQTFSADGLEGELGKAIATQAISIIRDIPVDTVFTFKTTGGTTNPREILTVPLFVGRRIMGIVSLATLSTYSDTYREILDHAQLGMDSVFSNLLAGVHAQQMAEELGASNVELQEQTAELQAQTVELEAQQQQVLDANRLKSEFLSNMSHELRTPLNSVLSLSQLMLENGMDTEGGENREHLEIIERNGRRLLNLINSILDLSKIEAGKMEFFVSSFSVAEMVDSIGASMRPTAKEKGLSFEIDVAEMAEMHSDKDKLQQILLNLLSNAQKFTEKGDIKLQVRSVGDSVVFTVRDTGCGISAEELPHIFDEFRQVDGSTTRQYGGTGLGLAISQRLTGLLDGEINVHSELGAGTTFTLTLPRVMEGEISESYDAPMELGDVQQWNPGAEPPRILVVDDNTVASNQLVRALKANGFVVDVAANGEEGLARTRDHLPDGILLDLMMPKVDGFQMLEAIRSTPETKTLPVLVLTAKDVTAAERVSLSYNNVQQLIQKGSLNRTSLIRAVRQLIGMKEETVVAKKPAEKPVRRVVRKKGGKVTVLIVDDHADNMTTTKAILGNMNLEILEAGNGKEALEVAKALRPDLILMDIQMPVMGGIEAMQLIREDKTLQDVVIIALTALAMTGDKEEILAAGCDEYLSKPIEPGTLQATVEKWMNGDDEV